MKKSFSFLLLLAVFATNSVALPAQEKTGAELLVQCQAVNISNPTPAELVKGVSCASYLDGMSEGFNIWHASNILQKVNSPTPVCVPTDVTRRELAMVVVKYLNDNPTQLHQPYAMVAFQAMRHFYPCK